VLAAGSALHEEILLAAPPIPTVASEPALTSAISRIPPALA
jgi:hypothetical protein